MYSLGYFLVPCNTFLTPVCGKIVSSFRDNNGLWSDEKEVKQTNRQVLVKNRDKMSFVCVHIGAGYHAPKKVEQYRKLCIEACNEGMRALRENDDATTAVATTVAVLEDSPLTNAGFGSNLTIDQAVECDAGLMEGQSLRFAGVGAVSGMKNPVQVAKLMVDVQGMGEPASGKKWPSLLVGPGVNKFAARHGVADIHPSQLISEQALKDHKKSLKAVTQGGKETDNTLHPALDTVGAICVDSSGNSTSAVSSGGILLKDSGRVGHASCFGCGCWAQTYNSFTSEECSVSASASGCGEDLMRVSLAKSCCDAVARSEDPSGTIVKIFTEQFLKSPFLESVSMKLGGAVVVKCSEDVVELTLAHTTHSFVVGYHTAGQQRPKVLVSRCPEEKVGVAVTVQGEMVRRSKRQKMSDT